MHFRSKPAHERSKPGRVKTVIDAVRHNPEILDPPSDSIPSPDDFSIPEAAFEGNYSSLETRTLSAAYDEAQCVSSSLGKEVVDPVLVKYASPSLGNLVINPVWVKSDSSSLGKEVIDPYLW